MRLGRPGNETVSRKCILTNNVLFPHHSKINGLFGKCLNVLRRKIS